MVIIVVMVRNQTSVMLLIFQLFLLHVEIVLSMLTSLYSDEFFFSF